MHKRRMRSKDQEPTKSKAASKMCLLMTDLKGEIVFVHGHQIFRFTHFDLKGKNFFKNLFDEAERSNMIHQIGNEILPPGKDHMEFVCQTSQMKKPRYSHRNDKASSRFLFIKCSRIQVKLQFSQLQPSKVPILEKESVGLQGFQSRGQQLFNRMEGVSEELIVLEIHHTEGISVEKEAVRNFQSQPLYEEIYHEKQNPANRIFESDSRSPENLLKKEESI